MTLPRIRHKRSWTALTVGVLALALSLATYAQTVTRYPELPNFHEVNPQLYRGGQPGSGGLQKLKELGVKTIVNLRGEDEHARREGEEARALGLRYFSIALPGFSKPKDEDVKRVLGIINTLENQPVFVHCHHGKDRTGTIVACYRMSHDGWNAEQAKDEAKRYGLSFAEIGMRRYIDNYYAALQRNRQSS